MKQNITSFFSFWEQPQKFDEAILKMFDEAIPKMFDKAIPKKFDEAIM